MFDLNVDTDYRKINQKVVRFQFDVLRMADPLGSDLLADL